MIGVDVNVLVRAWWPGLDGHDRVRGWLEDVVNSGELALMDLVVSGAIRVLTHPKVTKNAFRASDVLRLADELRGAPRVALVGPGPRHWSHFRDIVDQVSATGNEIPDCYLAAVAIENGLRWASSDRFFGRVTGLEVIDPVDASDRA